METNKTVLGDGMGDTPVLILLTLGLTGGVDNDDGSSESEGESGGRA